MTRAASRRGREAGSVITEAAIIIPVLIALIGGMVVMGIRLSNYLFMSQTLRELLLKMGTVPSLVMLNQGGQMNPMVLVIGPENYTPAAPTDAEASVCMDFLIAAGGTCSSAEECDCPRVVIQWYAANLIKSKRLHLAHDVTMNFTFGPHPQDPLASTGLCFLTIRLFAPDDGFMSWFGGGMDVQQIAPYVSNPVPDANLACVPL